MKSRIFFILIVLIGHSISGLAIAAPRHAVHGHGAHPHVGLGIYLGMPYHYYPFPYYYYPYSYYPPPVLTVPAQPPVYIEQGESQPLATPDDYYWYHCNKPEGYYPYIKECPAGWQRVSPTPPPQ